MAEWQERVQSMILGFVFAFMVMKLISVISSFRNANLRVTREVDEEGVGAGLSSVDEQSVPLTGTDEEVEADGGDEKEDRVDDSSSSSSEPESEDDAAPTSRSREVHTTDAAGVSEAESKDEEVKPKDDEEVEEIITPGAASLKALTSGNS